MHVHDRQHNWLARPQTASAAPRLHSATYNLASSLFEGELGLICFTSTFTPPSAHTYALQVRKPAVQVPEMSAGADNGTCVHAGHDSVHADRNASTRLLAARSSTARRSVGLAKNSA
eukprot:scaffold69510_cov14-Tisochrysis_lutea.AAC.1